MNQLQRLSDTYDIVTKYGCFDYEFIVIFLGLIVILYFILKGELNK